MLKYIDKNLLPDETILYRTKKHYIIFLSTFLWVMVTLFFLFNSNPYIVKLSLATIFIAFITGANALLTYVTSEFAITNKRVMMKEGFFFRHSTELRLATISNITSNQSLLAQMLNYGTIIISPFGADNDVFSEIANAFEFQKQAQIQLDKLGPPNMGPRTTI